MKDAQMFSVERQELWWWQPATAPTGIYSEKVPEDLFRRLQYASAELYAVQQDINEYLEPET